VPAALRAWVARVERSVWEGLPLWAVPRGSAKAAWLARAGQAAQVEWTRSMRRHPTEQPLMRVMLGRMLPLQRPDGRGSSTHL
jgi:hypothetical protein